MPFSPVGFDEAPAPPPTAAPAEGLRPFVETCVAAFGAERRMFESNFPVDKGALFKDSAARFYRLDIEFE